MSHRARRPAAESPFDTEGASHATFLDRALLDWKGAAERVKGYLSALGIGAPALAELTLAVLERALVRDSEQSAVCDAMDALPQVLLAAESQGTVAAAVPADDAFRAWRLARWQSGSETPLLPGETPPLPATPAPLVPTPPLRRGKFSVERFRGRRLGEWRRQRSEDRNAAGNHEHSSEREMRRTARVAWGLRGRGRRVLLSLLVIVPSILAGAAFLATLPAQVSLSAEVALAVFFGALFGWISVGFWTALFGFFVLLRGGDRFAITRAAEAPALDPDATFRTAIIMPVYHERVERVFAGLRAIRESLARVGAPDTFDIFILSDSDDPKVFVEEEAAWAEWCRTAEGGGGIFYRRRRNRQKRKSGNVADFCRRFGKSYRYMIVLDADSMMSGDALVRLVQLMESRPHVGVIQTAPRVVRARSLFARMQQFAGRLYGPMFAAGMHFWQLGDSPYWGHNAIIRVEPFMRHCGLPRLSGEPPLGGDILSHDFVEAAMLGRAGWSIWLAFDLPGSYEETPGSLLEEMQRDRRWCQGNLQHLRLLFTEGLASAHRALFLNGVFSYVSAVLWLGFLLASTTEAVVWSLQGPDYFSTGPSLFPTWPIWRPERALALFAVVACVLLLPKLLAVFLAIRRGEASGYGGVWSLFRSVLGETLASALFAPIRMTFYCRFVLFNLAGRSVSWRGGDDELHETGWTEAIRRHGADSVIACVWALTVHWLHPEAFWWLAPVAGALAFSVPSSALASRVWLGERARAAGWFVTPEEKSPPRETHLEEALLPESSRARGFVRAVVDPLFNAVHIALLRGPRTVRPTIRASRQSLVERALDGGPDALNRFEQRVLLSDAQSLAELHAGVWRLEQPEAARAWGLANGLPLR